MSVASGTVTGPQLPTCKLFGFDVSTADMPATLDAIETLLAASEPRIVVTADAFGLILSQTDPALDAAYKKAAIVTPDSSGVVWALRRKGQHVSRVSGVELVEKICALSANKGYRIFLLGSSPGVAEMAAEKLRLKHPGCNIVGTRHGFFPESDSDVIAREVAKSRPDVLFVAMGIPRQERFITSTLNLTGAKVAMGVGGSLDVYSGRVKRAPKWVQALDMEWLWRLILNPSKYYKVSKLPKYVWLVLRGKS